MIGAAGANATIECTGTPTFTAPTATDAWSGGTVNIVSSVRSCNECTTTTTRTWQAVDACGNTSGTVAKTITATDTQAPTIGAAGANATIECFCFNETAATEIYAVSLHDALQILSTVSSGNSCTTTTTRTWQAVDACGNTSGTVAQTITPTDTQATTIAATPAYATIECTGTPTFTAPTATDACSGATVNIVSTASTGNS